MEAKYSADGFRMCDQEKCELPATHTFIWAAEGWTCQCLIHAQQMVNLEAHLGFNAASHSLRKMTIDEMMPE